MKTNVMKKVAAIALSAMLVGAVTVPVWADPAVLTNGEVGGFDSDYPDVSTTQEKKINIKKEITAFNPTESFIYGPEIQYTYTIAAASGNELVNITDDTTDHVSGLATTTTALAGAGVTGDNPTLAATGDGSEAGTATIVWTNADILEASAAGTANYKNLTIDFTNVVFNNGPGVYRYKITETANAYTTSGVANGTSSNIRYLDVYVKRSDSDTSPYALYTNGLEANQWIIYGYVCLDSTLGTSAVTTNTVKTNGFVANSEGAQSSATTADQYHTYNLTIGKTLNGDSTMGTHEFPFDVAFATTETNASTSITTASETFQFAVKKTGNATVNANSNSATKSVNGTSVSAGDLPKVGGVDAVTTNGKDGDPTIANGATVTYIGIPSTIKATVTETNDVTGTTYATRVYANEGNSLTVNDVTTQVGFSSILSTAYLGSENNTANMVATTDKDDIAVYAQSAAPTADTNQWIQFSNTLSIISPTGVVIRILPFAIIVGGAVVLLVVLKRTKAKKDTRDI